MLCALPGTRLNLLRGEERDGEREGVVLTNELRALPGTRLHLRRGDEGEGDKGRRNGEEIREG